MAKEHKKKKHGFTLTLRPNEWYLEEGEIRQNKKKEHREKFAMGARVLVGRFLLNDADMTQEAYLARTYFALHLAYAGVSEERYDWLKIANVQADLYCRTVREAIANQKLHGRAVAPAFEGRVTMVEKLMRRFNASPEFETVETFQDVVCRADDWPSLRSVPTANGSKKPEWAKLALS